ncbi:hypothetical protein [Cytobacillus sp. IB215316]|uniref:alpha/beta hydrolase n=1 Tax=Cytobacillus sp. IB215316 TaxID=3097354 RepID=UPI002A134085|nr:hypothetical protein [Cytobacillus sp. IB215316]MDX8360708.1 hypothetical protein [Cytobacillus sp. IB215316]
MDIFELLIIILLLISIIGVVIYHFKNKLIKYVLVVMSVILVCVNYLNGGFKWWTFSIYISLFFVVSILSYLFPKIKLPKPTGEYNVGKIIEHYVDQSREEVFTKKSGDYRELIIQMWYPTDMKITKNNQAPYHPNSSYFIEEISKFLNIPRFLLNSVDKIETNSIKGARVSNKKNKYPVLLVSHAHGSSTSLNSFQIEELVSHGYIVVGIEHSYISSGIILNSGPIESQYSSSWEAIEDSVYTLSKDASFILDQIEIINHDHKILKGKFDLDHVGYFGHSSGGASVANTLALDDRFKAGINMDGYPLGNAHEIGVEEPFMYMRAIGKNYLNMRKNLIAMGLDKKKADNIVTDRGKRMKDIPRGEGFVLEVNSAEHFDFSDVPLWSPVFSMVGFTGKIKPKKAHRIINAYTLAFFDTYLKGTKDTLLTNDDTSYKEAKLHKTFNDS